MYIYKNDFNLNLETKKFFWFFLAFLTQTSNKPKESATNRSKHYSYTNFPMGKQIADFCRTSLLSCESVCGNLHRYVFCCSTNHLEKREDYVSCLDRSFCYSPK